MDLPLSRVIRCLNNIRGFLSSCSFVMLIRAAQDLFDSDNEASFAGREASTDALALHAPQVGPDMLIMQAA